jgi:acyl carrier protein
MARLSPLPTQQRCRSNEQENTAVTEPTIQDRVRTLVIEAAPIEVGEVRGDMSLADELGYDSLSLLELMSLLEAEFGLPPVDSDFKDVRTLADAEAMVERVLATVPAAAR